MTTWLDAFLYDLRHATRGLRRDRAFSFTAIAMLALAIGLNVSLFALMNTILFRGFPLVQRNDRLVYIQERNPLNVCCISYRDFEDWRTQAKSFEGMAFLNGRPVTLSDGANGPIFETVATTVSSNAFQLLGVHPTGRDFTPEDEIIGASVLILSHHFWESHFGKRPDIIGHTVQINKAPATVIGVMPEGFNFTEEANFWMPLYHTPEMAQRGPGSYLAFGRLKDGVSIATARAELETINRRLAAEFPATNKGVVPRVDSHAQFFMGPDAPIIYGSLWAAAWFVLLIACANLANLSFARTVSRSRELSTRIALGAGRARMMRQLLIESLLLAAAGGFLGWWIAKWGVRTWAAATQSPYQILDYTLNFGTIAYLVVVTLVATILFGIVPIFRTLQLDIHAVLKGSSRGATQGRNAKAFSRALIAGQMMLAVILLAGTGVILRSFLNIVRGQIGVNGADRVLTGFVRVPSDSYPTPDSRLRFFDSLQQRLAAIPGVETQSLATSRPIDNPPHRRFELASDPRTDPRAAITIVTGSDYFRAVGAILTTGRDFTDSDALASASVAIVNQSFAAKYWPGRNALGQRVRVSQTWRTVVGVASNIMQGDPIRQTFKPVLYIPFRQEPAARSWILVRTRVPAEAMWDPLESTCRHASLSIL